ncbi:transposase family protein [Legionella sp. km535]|nr:transposase family protein [Legionella sp. km535]
MMSSEDVPGFLYHFNTLEDPRIDRKKLYPLTELLFFEQVTKYQKEI